MGTADVCSEAAQVTTAAFAGSRAHLLFERNLMVYRRSWMIIFSGVFEPLFYLSRWASGWGTSSKVPGPGGSLVDYASFVAPALLASAAMNGAIYDATNVFWKLKYMRTYDAVLSTPIGPADVAVGETAWALFRGFLYAISFMAVAGVLGLIESPWGLLVLPAAVVIGFAFAGLGVAATTYMRTWQDFELIGLVRSDVLFSATFFPITTYPDAIQWVVGFAALPRRRAPAFAQLRDGGLGSARQPLLSARTRGRRSLPRPAAHREALAQVVQVVATIRRPQPRLSAYFRRSAGTDDTEVNGPYEGSQTGDRPAAWGEPDERARPVQVAL
jgi:lipooligosaccharide transport system permease protein